MKPKLQTLIKETATECGNAMEACLFTSSGVAKCEKLITALVEKVIADTETPPTTPPAKV